MHTSISHVAGTNKLIDKLHAVAAKLGIGASTPGDKQVLATDASGNSSWIKLTDDWLATGAAIALSKLAPGSSGILKSNGTTISAGNKVLDADIDNGIISLAKLVAGASGLVKSNGSVISAGNKLSNSDIDDATIALARLVAGSSGLLKSNGTVITAGNTISNSDIAAGANIAVDKLADGTARQILAMNAAGDTPTWTTLAIGATLVVAANDATAAEKASANYVCDGAQDHVEINAAIAALPSTGGKVLLSSGTFNIGITSPGTPIGVTINKNYTILEGSGHNTVLKFHASTINSTTLLTLSQSYTSARNMRLDGNKTNNVGATGHLLINVASIAYPVLENITAVDSAVYGMFTGSNTYGGVFKNVVIATCQNLGIAVSGCDTTKIPNIYIGCKTISNGAEGFSISSHGSILIGCSADSNLYNYTVATNPYNQLIGCKSRNASIGFYLLNVPKTQVVGCLSNDDGTGFQCASGASSNLISGCFAFSAAAYGFVVSGTNSNKNHISGCFSIENNYGIFQVDSNSYNTFTGNHIEDTVGHGIFIGGGSHHTVTGNFVLNSSTGSASYHGILVQSSDYNTIMNNVVRKGASSSPYGVYIYSGYYNLVGYNDLILGGATGPFIDSGTATRKTVSVAQSTAVTSATLAETTNNTLTDITDMSITIVSGGGDIEVELCGLLTNNTADTYSAIGFSLNGADTVDMAAFTPKTAGHYGNASCFYRWNGATLGTSYTIKAKFRTQTASTTKAQMYGRSMKVRELRNY